MARRNSPEGLFPSAYLDRWSCYRYKAVPRRNSSRVFPLTYCVIGPSQWLVVTHQRGCSPRLVWIVDPVIDMSQWLIVTRQGFPLDLIRIVDRWSCYRYESMTRRNSPEGLFPSAYLDRWSCYRYKAVPRRNSSRVFPLTYCVIGPSQWLVVTHQRGCSPRLVWIVDPVIDMSQWLIVTRQGFPLDLLWIGDPVIGTSQWLVVTHQGVFPLGFSVCRSARSHAYDSGVRLFLEREFCVSWIIIWPLSAIPGRWPWDIHIRRITLCQWHGINIYSMNIYMC